MPRLESIHDGLQVEDLPEMPPKYKCDNERSSLLSWRPVCG